MAIVTVVPETFTLVFYEADDIRSFTQQVAEDVGLPPDTAIRIEVNEATPLGQVTIASIDPIVLKVEGGAFEDPKRPRRLSETYVKDVLIRSLFRVNDRRHGGFGEAPPDDKLTLAENIAWEIYAVGRAARRGYLAQRPRRLYAFRNRHGFTDVADAAFDRLWMAAALTWPAIQAICAETDSAKQDVA